MTDEEIEHLWDTHVGDWTPRYPFGRTDVRNFARAVIASHEQARGQDFRTLLEEAVDDIEDLASYAPKYFREKLNIEGTLAKYRAALAGAGESK